MFPSHWVMEIWSRASGEWLGHKAESEGYMNDTGPLPKGTPELCLIPLPHRDATGQWCVCGMRLPWGSNCDSVLTWCPGLWDCEERRFTVGKSHDICKVLEGSLNELFLFISLDSARWVLSFTHLQCLFITVCFLVFFWICNLIAMFLPSSLQNLSDTHLSTLLHVPPFH